MCVRVCVCVYVCVCVCVWRSTHVSPVRLALALRALDAARRGLTAQVLGQRRHATEPRALLVEIGDVPVEVAWRVTYRLAETQGSNCPSSIEQSSRAR